MSDYRGRFAPSPTGSIHLGTARTALAAWLRARREGGRYLMRIEDLDAPRVITGATESILEDLRWLGLDWDEGPDVGGLHAPYVQSQRVALYAEAFERLRADGDLFPCTCSRKEIAEIASAPHGEEAIYPGTCRDRPSHPDRHPAWRFRMDDAPPFTDRLRGPSGPHLGAGDFVVRRSDGVFSYQLTVVVDDRAMEITEVVRGDDLIASTPRQIALHRALAKHDRRTPEPGWLHVPLVLGTDGERLSKRHGAIAVSASRDRGVAPEELVAMLGRSLGLDVPEPSIAPSALIERFDVVSLALEPTRIDLR